MELAELKEFFNNLPEGVSVIDSNMRIQWVNKYLHNKGFHCEGVKGQKCYFVYKKKNAICRHCPTLKAFSKGKTIKIVEKGADGNKYEVTAVPIFKDKKVDKVIEIVKEIRTCPEKLEKASNYLNLAGSIIVAINEEGIITFLNKKGKQVLGYRKNGIIGKNWFDTCIPKENREEIRRVFAKCMNGKLSLVEHYENQIVTKKGERRLIIWHNTTLKDKSGKTIGTLSSGEDITERKEALEEIRESWKKYMTVVQGTNDLIQSVRPDGSLAFVNDAWLKKLGYTRKEVEKLNVFRDIIHPDEIEHCRGVFKDMVGGREFKSIETSFITKKGKQIDVEGSVKLNKENGKVVSTYGIWRDITEKKKIEKELKESEEKFRNIVSSSPFGMHLYELKPNGDLVFTEANPAADRILGVDNRIFIGKTIEQAFPPLKKTEVPKRYKEAASKGKSWSTEQINYDHGKIKGAYEVFAFQTSPGKMVAAFTDITERKKIDEALKQSEEKYKNLTENTNDILYSYNNKGIMTYIGPQIRKYGINPSDIISKSIINMVLPEDRKRVMEDFKRTIASGKEFPTEFRAKDKKGNIIWIEELGKASKDSKGKITKVTGVLRDITDRKKAEEELRKSEERFRLLFEFAPDGYYLTDFKGTFIDGNKASEKITGYKKEELIGKSMLKSGLLPLRQIPKAAHAFIKNLRGIQTGPEEFTLVKKDGKKIETEIMSLPIEIGGKKLVLGIARDITERKKAERDVQKAKKRAETYLDLAADIILALVSHANIILLNESGCKLLGCKKDDIIGKNWFEVGIPKEKVPEVKKVFKSVIDSKLKPVEDYENEIVARGGEKRLVRWHNTWLKDENGKITGTLSSGQDVTEKKKAEEEIQKLASVVRYSTELVNMSDTDGRMIFINEAGGKMLGISPKEVGRHKILEVIPNHLMPLVKKELLPALLKGKTWQGDLQYLNIKTKKLTDVHAMTFPIKDPETGKTKYFANVSMDITKRKEDEKKIKEAHKKLQDAYTNLQEVDKIKDEFVSAAGHQLKTPLTSILGYLELLPPGTGELSEIQKEGVEMIRKNSKRLRILVEDILRSLKMQAPTLKLEKSRFELKNIFKKVLEDYKPELAKKKIEVVMDYPKKCPRIYADKKQIIILITNLIDNAIKYNKEGGKIEISGKIINNTCRISVENTGVGIKKQEMTRMFERFYQVNVSLSGTGLGLSISKNIVEAHGGKIWAESKGAGKGAKFIFTIPLKK